MLALQARKEKLELEGDRDRETRLIQKSRKRIELLEQQIHQFHEQQIRDTQVQYPFLVSHDIFKI